SGEQCIRGPDGRNPALCPGGNGGHGFAQCIFPAAQSKFGYFASPSQRKGKFQRDGAGIQVVGPYGLYFSPEKIEQCFAGDPFGTGGRRKGTGGVPGDKSGPRGKRRNPFS